jgi:hypothetical protein
MTNYSLLFLALAACGALACDGARRETPTPSAAVTSVTLGGKRIDVTLTLTEKDRRHAVPRLSPATETQGHLLAWPRERFMKIEAENSQAAFDIVFLDKAGTIVDLLPLKQEDEEGVMPRSPAAYALLLAPGQPQKLGVKVGDKAVLSAEILAAKPEELPTMKINGVTANVELAITEAERNHGLMFRPRLSTDDGMLFAYPNEDDRSFWMKNTLIPLDIAFFTADGTLLNVNETPTAAVPRQGPWPPSPSKGAARYVLEMNVGWFKKKGLVDGSGHIVPGSKGEIPPQATKGTYD